jgi:uncharacterized protein YndB with AHSA1/START domain
VRIVTTTVIHRPIQEVFDFLTTPGNWPRWHPSSMKVTGTTNHSLMAGEQVTEEFFVAGQSGTAMWTVRERQAPFRWVIDGVAQNGNQATITYTLRLDGGDTFFERLLEFTELPGLPAEALETFHRQVEAESSEALRRLKAVLEGLAPRA